MRKANQIFVTAAFVVIALCGSSTAQDMGTARETESNTAEVNPARLETAEVLYVIELEPQSDIEEPIEMWVDVLADGTNIFHGEWTSQTDRPFELELAADLVTGKFSAIAVEPDFSRLTAVFAASGPENPDPGLTGPVTKIFGDVIGYTHEVVMVVDEDGSPFASFAAKLDWCWDTNTGCQLPDGNSGFCVLPSDWEALLCHGTYNRTSTGPDAGLRMSQKTEAIFEERFASSPTGPEEAVAGFVKISAYKTTSTVTMGFSTTDSDFSGRIVSSGKHLNPCGNI